VACLILEGNGKLKEKLSELLIKKILGLKETVENIKRNRGKY
jgi:hypothetical protein